MCKQYLITNLSGKYYCRPAKSGKKTHFTTGIKKAVFFDSTAIAYDFITRNPALFTSGLEPEFYEIKCIVITNL